jgi:starvation-inducible DNA-binding protein
VDLAESNSNNGEHRRSNSGTHAKAVAEVCSGAAELHGIHGNPHARASNQTCNINKVHASISHRPKYLLRRKQMPKKQTDVSTNRKISTQPRLHQRAQEIQAYGTVSHMLPLELEEPVRLEMTEQLNQLLADTMTLRDLYKKSHWQVAGPTFYQLHLLYDKHYEEQVELVDSIAERIQLLGGISLAMAADVAETTQIERPPRGREEVPVQLSRLIDAHQVIIRQARTLARRASQLGDDGTNDLVVSEVLRTNELRVWFLSEHLVNVPLVQTREPSAAAGAA